jgi:hypothetical protein
LRAYLHESRRENWNKSARCVVHCGRPRSRLAAGWIFDNPREERMKKFLVLYRSAVSAMDQMASTTPAQRKAEMDKWMAWGATAGTALVDWGAPLGESAVVRGSKSPGFVGGYSIVQADSLDSAKRLVDGHPHFGAPGASIELFEMMSMPGK